MKRLVVKYLLGLSLLFAFTCKQSKPVNKKVLPEEWYKIQSGPLGPDSLGYNKMVLRLYDDGTYTQYAVNFYSFGKWIWSERKSELVLEPTSGTKFTRQTFIVRKSPDGQLQVQKEKWEGSVMMREKMHSSFSSIERNLSAKDPFSVVNNSWRIKPSTSETMQQIKDRMVNYLNFLEAYYQHAIDNNMKFLTNGWYPAPLQMNYSNGVRMAYNTEVADWYACFYNDSEAIEAYKMIRATIRKITVKPIENKAERNMDIVNQMLKAIELPKN